MARWRTLHRRRRQASDPKVMLCRGLRRMARAAREVARGSEDLRTCFGALVASAFGDALAQTLSSE